MAANTLRKFQALILGATGLFLLQKIWSGTLYWYINERFLVLVLIAAAGFLFLAQSLLNFKENPSDEAYPADLSDSVGENRSLLRNQVITLLLVATPLLLGLLIPARPLGASAATNKVLRNTTFLNTNPANHAFLLEIPAENRTIMDWLQLTGIPDQTSLTGEPVNVIGFVYQDPRLAENQFLVGRFLITCCTADAFVVSMVVNWPDADTLPSNQWVQVIGKLAFEEMDGTLQPLVQADTVQKVGEPAQPYLFP
jgi:putative membrane protein